MSARAMPTEAQIMRFVKAVSRVNPDLARIRMTRNGDLEAERADGTAIEPQTYDAIDMSRK